MEHMAEGGPSGTRYNRSKSGWFDGVIFDDWFSNWLYQSSNVKEGPPHASKPVTM